MRKIFTGFLVSAVAVPAAAQVVPSVAPAPSVVVPASRETSPVPAEVVAAAVLRTGTEIQLKLSEQLTTKDKVLKVGQRFRLETGSPVVIQSTTVIPAGAPAVGEITEVRNKGMWGKSGHFTGRLLYLTVNGRHVRLSGTFDEKGFSGGWAAGAVSAVVFLPAGFFMTGTSATLPIGTPVRGFIDEDVPLALKAEAAAPLVVTTSAVPAPVSAPASAMPAAQPDVAAKPK